MRILAAAGFLLAAILLAGCSEGPHPFIFVQQDSIVLANTYGNYPEGWAPWGHVTLVTDELLLQDASDGETEGLQIHKMTDSGSWVHVETDRFGLLFGGPSDITFAEPGNYSISVLERGGPGRGVHANVTVLTVAQGCGRTSGGWECDYYREPADPAMQRV